MQNRLGETPNIHSLKYRLKQVENVKTCSYFPFPLTSPLSLFYFFLCLIFSLLDYRNARNRKMLTVNYGKLFHLSNHLSLELCCPPLPSLFSSTKKTKSEASCEKQQKDMCFLLFLLLSFIIIVSSLLLLFPSPPPACFCFLLS